MIFFRNTKNTARLMLQVKKTWKILDVYLLTVLFFAFKYF